MKVTSARNAEQAWPFLEQGETLCCIETRALLKADGKKVRISMPGCFFSLDRKDFFEIYQGYSFSAYEKRTDIDEKKDEEYYAWRREKL